ncbi:hypothetical protein [Coprobacter tertius]|uniref:Uncharacterized protein n=1 Tax=Coprobacter tertius TaxID=2944915 RepID=A0ABT1MEW4_9BACT|nr:hypothetical protein [Coprobacter tertius]MCP9611170.1 hypothetical protein [Coprobacter tertius]
MKKLLISIILGILVLEPRLKKPFATSTRERSTQIKAQHGGIITKMQTKSNPVRGYRKVCFGDHYLVWRFKKGIPKPGIIESYYNDETPHDIMVYNDRESQTERLSTITPTASSKATSSGGTVSPTRLLAGNPFFITRWTCRYMATHP